MLFAWRAYEKNAWGHDELKPLTKTSKDWYGDPLLMTPVDALDTLLLMGLKDEAEKAKALIVEKLSFDKDISVKNFEVTIRLLGGLLSGYQMTGDERLRRLAEDLGTRLLPAFDSPTGLPYMFVNLKTGKGEGRPVQSRRDRNAPLEFGTLGKLTKKPVFLTRRRTPSCSSSTGARSSASWGREIDVETGQWVSRASHVGGGSTLTTSTS
jgi:hypothetical protein